MAFLSIVRKNFIHNFNKYISFYFVNSLIVAMLFMYGSLMYNPAILNSVGKTTLFESIKIALVGLIMFSVVFITYTNMAFLKNRGKEFGMYLTLGMTTKDLSKLIFVENLGIMIISLITGILGGVLFGRLFYMGLNKILNFTSIPYRLTYKSLLLCIGVFGLIFLSNVIFNMFYIRRVSIIDAIRSSKKKGIGKSNILIGTVALVLLIVSIDCLPKAIIKEIFKDQSYMIGVIMALTLICPYMIIGSIIGIVKAVTSKFPKLYNRNILVLSNLSHRFLAYKNILYMLSLLVAGAMFFVGITYSLYVSSRETINIDNPFDIMFVETNEYNKVEKENIEKTIFPTSGKVEKYKILEYIEVPMFKDDGRELSSWSDSETVISETNYNKHMGTDVDVKANEAIYVTVFNEKMNYEHPTSVLVTLNETQLKKVKNLTNNKDASLSKEAFKNIAGETTSLYLDKNNIKYKKGVAFANNISASGYPSGSGLVVDDKSYKLLKNNLPNASVKKLHLINVKNAYKSIGAIDDYLKKINGLDNSYWNEEGISGLTSEDERGVKEAYRPVYKEELVKLQLKSNGIMFFTMIFIGALFLVANGVVLYYKVLSDIKDEEERITSLTRIGVTQKEIKSMISKELAITFFTPILIGGGLSLYYIYVLWSNSSMVGLLMKKSLIVLICGTIIQIIFYLISRKKYIKEVI